MIYLDNAATTELDENVLNEMLPYLKENYGNPSSQHVFGRNASSGLESARDKIAVAAGCFPEEIFFVSGGTEAGNWALKGACAAYMNKGRHLIVSSIEHPALIESAKDMRRFGYEVTFIDPDKDGVITPESVLKAVREDTVFCAVMSANNETGVIQPVEEIGAVLRERDIFYYADCVQSAGCMPLPVKSCSACGVSAHKFYGPKGSGFLYLKKGTPISRLISGGKQERGLRGGTLNVACAVGCAAAFSAAQREKDSYNLYVGGLRDYFSDRVLNEIDCAKINGGGQKAAGTVNISFCGTDSEKLLIFLDLNGIAVSAGAACSAGAVKSSPVLAAMGLCESRIKSAVRFSFGKHNKKSEADETVEILKKALAHINRQGLC